jgi:hypothetical protein
MKFRILPIIAAAALGAGAAQSATLVDWDFSGLDWSSGGGSGLALNDPAPNPILTSASANAAPGLSSSDLTPSTGVSPNGLRIVVNPTTAPGEADVRDFDFNGNGGNDNYMEFTLTADAPSTLNIDFISISEWRNGAGAPDGMAFDVSVDGGGFALYDAVQVDPNSGNGPSFDTFTFTEAITDASTVVIRFTPRNVNQGSTGNIHINNIQVGGDIIPEPSSLAFLGLACVPLLRRRRA